MAFFFEQLSLTEEIHANWRRKNVLVLRQWAVLFQFSKFRNVQTQNNILKFLLLLANIGCYNCLAMVNIIISIFPLLVFLKQLIYLSSFLVIHFLISKKTSTCIIFLRLKNIDYSYIVLKTLNNINLNNFSLVDPCCEINFGKKKFENCTLLCKSFLRIISIKLFVIWQV